MFLDLQIIESSDGSEGWVERHNDKNPSEAVFAGDRSGLLAFFIEPTTGQLLMILE